MFNMPKKKSKPFVLMVTDYTGTAGSHTVLQNPEKKNSQLQTCATSHEKGKKSTEVRVKRPESRAQSMKTHL